MANFKKGDLSLKYDWTAAAEHDNSNLRGFPDNRYLNRHEGYEVLHFLNRYMETRGFSSTATLHRLESEIRNNHPGQSRTHQFMRQWLDENFSL